MTKNSILIVIMSILLVFFTVNSFAEDAALKVIAKNGKVLVNTYPSKTWTDLTLGQVVHSKDVIKTDLCDAHAKETKHTINNKGQVCPVCGAVTLELPDKSSLAIKPDSEVSIDDLVLNNTARKLKVKMTKGELRMIVTKVSTPSDFSVKTPNAIYGATGTIYYVKSGPTGTSVYVGDGSINAINPIDGKIYTVVAGMMITFNADGTVVGPVPVSDVDVSNWTTCYADASAEPYEPPVANNSNLTPPGNTNERAASGG